MDMDSYSGYAEAIYKSLTGDNLKVVDAKYTEGRKTGRGHNRSLRLALSYLGYVCP